MTAEVLGQAELAPIDPGRILFGHAGRITLERHTHVGVVRVVADPLEGPAARNLDRAPVMIVVPGFEHCLRYGLRRGEQAEVPGSVER